MRALSMSRRTRWLLGIVGLAAAALIGSVALAASSADNVVYYGCYGNDGYLRVVDPAAACKKHETAIEWNQQGPPGSPGASAARAYVAVEDYPAPWPALTVKQSLNITAVERVPGQPGTYLVSVDPSLGNPRNLVATVTPVSGSGEPRYATTAFSLDDRIQVAIFNSSGAPTNSGFNLVVAAP